jgi:hypothetical protein
MRSLVLVAMTVALAVGASVSSAATTGAEADAVTLYKTRFNMTCRALTIVALSDIQKLTAAAKTGNSAAVGKAYGGWIGHGYAYTKVMLSIPVPPAARQQMRPIRRILARQVALIEAGSRKNDLGGAIAAISTDGPALDRLFDKAALHDCGARQTKILASASKELDSAMKNLPHA